MKFEIRKLSRANIEVIEAYLYYESKSIGLGERFLQELEEEFVYVSQNLELYQRSHKNFRQAYLRLFPFAIIFAVESEFVIVYSVFNTHQDPIKKP